MSQNGRKKWFPLARKNSLNKRILFQLDRKLVSTSGNGELLWEFLSFSQKEKLLPLTEISKISKKMVANSSNNDFK